MYKLQVGTKGQSFALVGLTLEENKVRGCQQPGGEVGGLEANFLLWLKGGPFACCRLNVAVCEQCPCEGTGWNQALGVNVRKGPCWREGCGSISSPSRVPNLLEFGSSVIKVS